GWSVGHSQSWHLDPSTLLGRILRPDDGSTQPSHWNRSTLQVTRADDRIADQYGRDDNAHDERDDQVVDEGRSRAVHQEVRRPPADQPRSDVPQSAWRDSGKGRVPETAPPFAVERGPVDERQVADSVRSEADVEEQGIPEVEQRSCDQPQSPRLAASQ